MGKRALPTMQALSEAVKTRAGRGKGRAKLPLETRRPNPKDMIREVRLGGGYSSRKVWVQLTESAGVVDVDDEISWC